MASLTSEEQLLIRDNLLSADIREFASKIDASERRDISRLLLGLQGHPVAERLRSTYRHVNGEIASIYARLHSEDLDLVLFEPLITLIANEASDVEIWAAVLALISTVSRISPGSSNSIPPTFNGTPRTYSSASYRNSVQKRKDLEEPMRHELAGSVYIEVQGFYQKYFENRSWSKTVERLVRRVRKDADVSFPDKAQPEEQEVWEWLDRFQQKYLTGTPSVYYRTRSVAGIEDAQGQRQLDICLKSRKASVGKVHSARDITVIGELTKSSKDVWKKKFLQMSTYIRDVFAAQPTRWFVHGFLMFGTQMELWIFDRSGAFGSEMFDVREDPDQFVKIMAGYAMMSDQELGLSPFVHHRNTSTMVTVSDATTGEDRDLQLDPEPFVSQAAVVSRGTTCFRTVDRQTVVKMSWRSDKQYSESDLLAKAQGVKGVPRLVGFKNVTTIEDLRSGLTITKHRKLGPEAPTRSPQQSTSTGKLIMSSSNDDEASLKKHRSSQGSTLRQKVNLDNFEGSPAPSPYRNRILTCIAIAPIGRPLHCFQTLLEVLQAFRDAIKAHRSLFLDRHILHRDISIYNIILTDPAQNDGCTSVLIDLDLAVVVGEDGKNESSEAKKMTGTLEYMAIEILQNHCKEGMTGIEHTYRHDLESFFYVLLSLCIRYPFGAEQKSDPLRFWNEGSIQQICMNKKIAIAHGSEFEDLVLDHFSPTFDRLKPLARQVRKILFATGRYFETPREASVLYDPMIEAFEVAIQDAT